MTKVSCENPVKSEGECVCLLDAAEEIIKFVGTSDQVFAGSIRVIRTKDSAKKVRAVARKFPSEIKTEFAVPCKR
jgi:hypothetical protein